MQPARKVISKKKKAPCSLIINFFLKLLGLRDSFFLTTSPSPPAAQPRFVCALGLLVLELREKVFFMEDAPVLWGGLVLEERAVLPCPAWSRKMAFGFSMGRWCHWGRMGTAQLLGCPDPAARHEILKARQSTGFPALMLR